MQKFNENLFREKRGMNRRISHDVEIKNEKGYFINNIINKYYVL